MKKHYAGEGVDEGSPVKFFKGIDWLTGKGSTANRNASDGGFGTLFESCETKLKNIAKYHRVGIVCTGYVKPSGDAANYLMQKHCYGILGYDPVMKHVRLIDPRGGDGPNGIWRTRRDPGWGSGEFWVTLDEYQANFLGMAYGPTR